ncbi:MAG TPA: TetR/AcrR family transcriptional regulator [Prolixibacteraceae bacterium]|nr:TetR/AcrR family transcriptional regulator [Prolixibacteraceae bacterium]HPR59620.1 TetR/AcrR family transcriptional regulator [Prolixibacteraceae bacterium]
MKERDQNMEQLILETAERLFMDKGFALTSTTEIAREAGCNQALVHYYFRTKEKLFESIFERKAQLMLSAILKMDDPSQPFEERLRNLVENHFDIMIKNPKLPFLFLNELLTNPKRLDIMTQKLQTIPMTVMERFADDLQKEIDKGRIRDVSPISILLTVLSLNLTPFIIKPIFQKMTNISEELFLVMIEERKKENIRIIMRSLMP